MPKRISTFTVSSIVALLLLFGFGKTTSASGASGPLPSEPDPNLPGQTSPTSYTLSETQNQTKQTTCDVPIRIMPLGDSITKGVYAELTDETKQIGYRKDLWDLLVASDYNVDFVGSLINGDYYTNFDPDHEGHGGKADSYIAANIYGSGGESWLTSNPADIILLHIGTNGLDPDPSDVENILDKVDQFEANSGTHVTVVLARIINRIPYSSTTTDFNDNVEAMAQLRIAAGDDIVIVDMEDGAGIDYQIQPDGDMSSDTIHPYSTGYTKMAAVWYAALTGILEPCINQPPVVEPIADQANAEGDSVSLQVVAHDPNSSDVLTYSASGLPSGLDINPSSGLIHGVIGYQAAAGSPHNVTVTVTDDGTPTESSQVQFSWTVENTNRPPQVTDPGDQISAEGDLISLLIQASEPDGEELSFEALGLPPGLEIDPLSGLISGSISYTASSSSPYTIMVIVSDHYSPPASIEITFTWSISNTNRSQVVANPGTQKNFENELINLQIQANDPDGDTLSFAASGLPDGLVIEPDTGLIHGMLPSHSQGRYSVQVIVSDGDPNDDVLIDFTWMVMRRYFLPFLSINGL